MSAVEIRSGMAVPLFLTSLMLADTPHRADVGEPNTDDPEGGAGYLTSV